MGEGRGRREVGERTNGYSKHTTSFNGKLYISVARRGYVHMGGYVHMSFDTHGSQMRALEPLELDLQEVVSELPDTGAGNRILVLNRSS